MSEKLEVDLTGPCGNAFYLLGLAKKFANMEGKDYADIQSRMVSSDYENLLKVFDSEFGHFVTLYR